MARFAPEKPTTAELYAKYPIPVQSLHEIEGIRSRVSQLLGGRTTELLAVIGPCAMTQDEEIIYREGGRLAQLTSTHPNILALHRLPPWKPRSKSEDWHGLETSDPERAFRTLATCAIQNANSAIEIGDPTHLERYGSHISLAWKGARSQDPQLTKALAMYDTHIPVAIKNNLTGNFGSALDDIETINNMRGSNGANAALLFRGGVQAQTPWDWERLLLHTFNQSKNVIVDVAHGGEMAHDPKRHFGKSTLGQIACLDHLIQIARQTGRTPSGVMIEASDAKSPTDPVIPFEAAIERVMELADIKQATS